MKYINSNFLHWKKLYNEAPQKLYFDFDGNYLGAHIMRIYALIER